MASQVTLRKPLRGGERGAGIYGNCCKKRAGHRSKTLQTSRRLKLRTPALFFGRTRGPGPPEVTPPGCPSAGRAGVLLLLRLRLLRAPWWERLLSAGCWMAGALHFPAELPQAPLQPGTHWTEAAAGLLRVTASLQELTPAGLLKVTASPQELTPVPRKDFSSFIRCEAIQGLGS